MKNIKENTPWEKKSGNRASHVLDVTMENIVLGKDI